MSGQAILEENSIIEDFVFDSTMTLALNQDQWLISPCGLNSYTHGYKALALGDQASLNPIQNEWHIKPKFWVMVNTGTGVGSTVFWLHCCCTDHEFLPK